MRCIERAGYRSLDARTHLTSFLRKEAYARVGAETVPRRLQPSLLPMFALQLKCVLRVVLLCPLSCELAVLRPAWREDELWAPLARV